MVVIVSHVCGVLVRPGVDYLRQTPAPPAASEGLGIVLARAMRR